MLLDFAVLGLIARTPRHGYQLQSDLVASYGRAWQIDVGHLYRVLTRLEREGWARSRAEAGDGGPPRKVFRATPRGRAALGKWVAGNEGRTQHGRDPSIVRQYVAGDAAPLRIVGSDDPLLADLSRRLATSRHGTRCETRAVGSLGGLLALREGRADIAGMHLLDAESGSYNLPFVRSLLPEEETVVVHLARREQGLIVAAGNPHRVRSVGDLGRKRIRYVNRQRDAGTRLLLWHRFRAAGVDPRRIEGYAREVATHDEVATEVRAGRADVGPGVRAAAVKYGLDFLPVGEENFDLVIPRRTWSSPRLREFVAVLHDAEFRRHAASLPGYDLSDTGTVTALGGAVWS